MTGFSQENCDNRHGRLWKIVCLLLTVMGLFVAIAGWSMLAGHAAQTDAQEVKTEFQVHEAAQEEREKNVTEKLVKIQTTVEKIDGKLDMVLRERHIGGD